MKKKNSSELAYDQKKFIADFIGCECFESDVCTLQEYDESIAEINAMIAHNIELGDKKEVKQWRELLQQTKVEKRRAKRMIERKNAKGLALA